MQENERLTDMVQKGHAVPRKFDLDFAFNVDDETWQGLREIFNRLNAYEDSGLSPEEVAELIEHKATETENIDLRKENVQYRLEYFELKKALKLACEWVSKDNCTRYPGHICDKDFEKDGVCMGCFADYFIQQAREQMTGHD